VAHPLVSVWAEDGGVVIFEVTTSRRLHDDRVMKINACSIVTAWTAGSPANASTSTTPRSTPSSTDEPHIR
jgi:hypothetical protein